MSTAPRIGTAGWSYQHWNGVVYPKTYPPGFHPLEFLARRLNAVEINSSFYQPLKPEVVKLWLRKVEANSNFQFTAKLHQQFTHGRVLEEPEVARFKEGLRPLLQARKLGAVLMQFPWAFRFTAENREFLIRLRRAFHEFPLVAEMRHSSWLTEEAVGTFLDYHIGFCNIDQPQLGRSLAPTEHVTSSVGYVRLHGRNYEQWFDSDNRDDRYNYLYKMAELEKWKDKIRSISQRAESTYVIANNHFQAKAAVNALELRHLLDGRRVRAPSSLVSHYPQLRDMVEMEDATGNYSLLG